MDFIFDFETLGTGSDAVVINCALVCFDYKTEYTFQELLEHTVTFRLNVEDQVKRGRVIDESTLEWWSKQSKEAQAQLKPQEGELTVREFIDAFKSHLNVYECDLKRSIGYCRGQSFDFPIAQHMAKSVGENAVYFPCAFWNQRDVRSIIAGYVGNPAYTMFPLEEEDIPGFIAHNPSHDICRDVIMMQKARKTIYE